MALSTALVWFRTDLRIRDNPALRAAIEAADDVVALFVHETDPELRAITGATRWWLHHSLQALARDLARLGITLRVETGGAAQTIERLVRESKAVAVFWNRRYSPAERTLDAAIKTGLEKRGVSVKSFSAHLLVEPSEIATGAGKPYSVYSPFWKALRERHIAEPLAAPKGRDGGMVRRVDDGYEEPRWAKKLADHWTIGEDAAREALADFLDGRIADYTTGRDFPARSATSRLSPHLRFGEIGPRQVWHAATALAQRDHHQAEAVGKFLSELAWREFNYHQLYHREDIANVPMQARYGDIEWRGGDVAFERWTRGQTGFPIIDAGMRELWETGSMHNRVRMLVASLLAKNLLIDWRKGERWFWDCLVDADIANNPGNWQWVAGTGLDAAPYFRIFNPVTQGERFDADGTYVRRWVPEIARLPDKWVHKPFAAPSEVLRAAGVELGKTYPEPLVDLKLSRQRALEAAGIG